MPIREVTDGVTKEVGLVYYVEKNVTVSIAIVYVIENGKTVLVYQKKS